MTDLHKAVKIATFKKGTTITAIAEKMSINRKTLYSAMGGNARIGTIDKVAEALDMKTSELIALGEGE